MTIVNLAWLILGFLLHVKETGFGWRSVNNSQRGRRRKVRQSRSKNLLSDLSVFFSLGEEGVSTYGLLAATSEAK